MRRYESNFNLLKDRNQLKRANSLRSVNSMRQLISGPNNLLLAHGADSSSVQAGERNKFLQKTFSQERGLTVYKLKDALESQSPHTLGGLITSDIRP